MRQFESLGQHVAFRHEKLRKKKKRMSLNPQVKALGKSIDILTAYGEYYNFMNKIKDSKHHDKLSAKKEKKTKKTYADAQEVVLTSEPEQEV